MGVLFLWGIFFFSVALLHSVFSAMKFWCYQHLVLGGAAGTSEIGPSVLLWQQTGISWVTVMRICREQKTCPYGICFICSDCRITFLKFLLWFWTEMWKWPCFFLWGIYEKLENFEDRRKKEYMAMWAWICHPYDLQWENYQYLKKYED